MLWFERVSARLSLPTWAVGIAVGGVPFFLLYPALAVFYPYLWDMFTTHVQISPFPLLVGLYCLLASRYIRVRIESLREYTQSLSDEGEPPSMRSLYSFRTVLLAWTATNLVVTPLFISSNTYPTSYSFVQKIVAQTPWIIWGIAPSTLIWTWIYSMYSVRQMGKLSLKLKPFTEDRTLGLRPFASTTMRLTLVYLAALAMITLPNLVITGPQVQIFFVGMFLLGSVFFLLPLHSLHQKLVSAKQEKLRRIKSRYTHIMQQFEENSEDPDQKLHTELLVIKEVQRDIQGINTWPFDTVIFTRLLAVILSVVAIIVARIVQVMLHL